MSQVGKHESYINETISHPIEFYNSLFQVNMKLSRQQMELLSKSMDLCVKECHAMAHINKPELLAEDSKEIYTDMGIINKATADLMLDAVFNTAEIVDHLSIKGANKKPRARVRRSSKHAESKTKQAA